MQEATLWDYIPAIQKVKQGQTYACSVTEKRLGLRKEGTTADPRFKNMTSMTYQIIALCILHQRSNTEIAAASRLSEKSVPTCKKRLKEFIGTLTPADLEDYLKMAEEKGKNCEG